MQLQQWSLFQNVIWRREHSVKKSMTCFYKCMEFEQKGKRVRVGNEEMLESAWRSAKNKSYAWTCLPKQTDTPSWIVQAFEKKSWSNQAGTILAFFVLFLFRCASISWIHVGDWFMFLRFCQIFGMSSGYVQGMLRVCSGCVQSVFRVCSKCVQSMFRVCSKCVQSRLIVGSE